MLLVSYLSQAIHVAPFERAAGKVGALYSSADASRFDAFRTASLVRQLQPSVVFGVDDAVLDGLADLERDPAEVFAAVRSVVASGTTAQADSSMPASRPELWLRLGPLNAVGGPRRGASSGTTPRAGGRRARRGAARDERRRAPHPERPVPHGRARERPRRCHSVCTLVAHHARL